MSDSLRPHESQHARPSCPSPTPGVHSDSRPSSQWCHPAISSSVIPFSSCLQSFPALVKEPACQFRRHKRRRFDPWVRKIPWRRAWQPISVFLPGESHGQRSPGGHKESDMTEQLSTAQHRYYYHHRFTDRILHILLCYLLFSVNNEPWVMAFHVRK